MRHKHIKRYITFAPIYSLIKISKRVILPGFEKLSFYIVSKFFFKGIQNGTLNTRASSLSFSFFLALFPTIIFLFTLIPYIPISHFKENLFILMQDMMPKAAFEATKDTIQDIIQKKRGGLLSVGFFSALYFSTNGFNAMVNAFNSTYHEIEPRGFWAQRLVSLFMLIVSVTLISSSIALYIGTERLIHPLKHTHNIIYLILHSIKWVILFGLCYSIVSFNYFVGPKKKKGWSFFSAGSMFATVLIVIATVVFSFYVNKFGKYNKLYGSIGSLIVVMMIIYINSFILLLGFDLNTSIHGAKRHLESFDKKRIKSL